MKRIPFLIVAALLTVAGTFCAHAQKVFHGDLALSWLDGPVKKVENPNTKAVLLFDRNGFLTEKSVKGKPKYFDVESRDSAGRPLRVVSRDVPTAPGLLSIYTYDSRGRIITEVRKNNLSGKTLIVRRYIYDGAADQPSGYCEKLNERDLPANPKVGDPDTVEWSVEIRDEKGNPIKRTIAGFIDENYIIEYYTE